MGQQNSYNTLIGVHVLYLMYKIIKYNYDSCKALGLHEMHDMVECTPIKVLFCWPRTLAYPMIRP